MTVTGALQFSTFLAPLPLLERALVRWASEFPDQFWSDFGQVFTGDVELNTQYAKWDLCPRDIGGEYPSELSCRFFHNGVLKHFYHVPLDLLRRRTNYPYHAYSVQFFTPEGGLLDPVLSSGYTGVTKRHPTIRFREHFDDVRRGGGHLLHSAWRGLLRSGTNFVPSFHIRGAEMTQSDIFDVEEQLVADFTLSPKGLNVIPGGMAGIRMLHELGALKRARADIQQRDAALVKLERQAQSGKCTHYRSGHVRHLDDDRITWVRSCWINLDKVAA